MVDKSILKMGLNEWRNQFAVVGQKPYLFYGTVQDNIDLYNEKDDEDIETLEQEYETAQEKKTLTESKPVAANYFSCIAQMPDDSQYYYIVEYRTT